MYRSSLFLTAALMGTTVALVQPLAVAKTLSECEALAVVNKRLTGDNGGYTIIYSAPTLPGMSGGGVFNGNGQLVAIHGYGDRFRGSNAV
jgi:V8-like Glu-specific endopeptidase